MKRFTAEAGARPMRPVARLQGILLPVIVELKQIALAIAQLSVDRRAARARANYRTRRGHRAHYHLTLVEELNPRSDVVARLDHTAVAILPSCDEAGKSNVNFHQTCPGVF